MWESSEILRILEQNSTQLRQMGVRKIGLFGSYRRGTPASESDMDFLVVLERPSFDTYMDLKFFLEDLFDVLGNEDLPRRRWIGAINRD